MSDPQDTDLATRADLERIMHSIALLRESTSALLPLGAFEQLASYQERGYRSAQFVTLGDMVFLLLVHAQPNRIFILQWERSTSTWIAARPGYTAWLKSTLPESSVLWPTPAAKEGER